MDSATKRLQALMLGNGFLVLIMGMVFGFALGFSLLEAIDLWPLPSFPVDFPGRPEGWANAHAGAISNGLMVIAVALALPTLALQEKSARWVAWGLVATAWGNTLFYLLAPIAGNRALSMGDNRFGETSLAGILGFTSAMVAATLVIVALAIAARAAFARASES